MSHLTTSSIFTGVMTGLFIALSGCNPAKHSDTAAPLPHIGLQLENRWQASLDDTPKATNLSQTPWLNELRLPALSHAVSHALANNPSLQASARQVEAIKAKLRIAQSQQGPELSLNAQSSRQRTNTATPRAVYSESYSTGAQLSWELDLWGRLRDNRRAASFDLKAQQALLDGARLSLVGRLSQAWLDATAQFHLDKLIQQRLTIQTRLLADAEHAYRKGNVPASTIQRQRATLSRTQADANQQRQLRDQSQRLIQRLGGNYPALMPKAKFRWPTTAGPISPAVPVSVLEQRWDVGQAGLAWHAASARVKAAKKSRLPSISLTGNVGTSSTDAGDLLDPDYLVWSILGNISAPVWKSGAILADINASQAQAGVALANFRDTILTALLEVEQYLAQDTALRQQLTQLNTALAQRERAANTLAHEYRQGVVDYDAYQTGALAAIDAREQVIRRRATFWTNRINLYLALGGPAVETLTPQAPKPTQQASSHD